jgi:hypothetical protein
MSPEHYLPAALGTFTGYEPLQGRVCRPCNNRIGREIETHFLRSGQIVFFRWLLGIEGRNGLPPSPFRRGESGIPPLLMTAQIPGFPYPLALEVEPGTENVYPLRQIVFDGGLAGVHPIVIFDRMRDDPAVLKTQLRDRGLEGARPLHAFADEDEIEWMGGLMRAFGGDLTSGEWATTQLTPQRLPLVVDVAVTSAHFRAVAKIVFHYALKMFPDLTGQERQFDPIKDFIWNGGDIDRFVRQRRPEDVILNYRQHGPTHWMHVLGSERTYDRITGWFQPFTGPQLLPPIYEVRLGMDPSRIVRRREQTLHQFVIVDATAPAGIVGVMEDGQPANYIRPLVR